jgi:hypothetical protein
MPDVHKGKILEFLVINNKEHSLVEIAEGMEISRTTLYKWFGRPDVPDHIITKFCEFTNVSPDIFEKGPLAESNIAVIQKGVPVYDVDFAAGDVTHFKDFPEKVIGYIYMAGFRNCIAFVTVKGNSMFPMFTAGDVIGLEPQQDMSHIDFGHPYGIVTKGGNRFVKIIRKGKDSNHLILRSYNTKDYDDIDIHKNDIQTLYKAHGPVRDSHY